MPDPLARVPPGPPCPNCGCTESLEAMDLEIRRLEAEKRRRRRTREQAEHDAREAQIRRRMAKQAPPIIGALGTVGVTFTAGGSDGVSSLGLDKLTCSGCGLWFTGEFAADAETMRNQLRELHIELDGAVGCLGRLADDG